MVGIYRFGREDKEKSMEKLRMDPFELSKLKSCRKSKLADVLTGLFCSLIAAAPAFADSQTIIQGINKGTEQVWRILIAVVAPIGAVALALQVIKIIWGGARAAEEAKSAAIKIIVAIAVVLMAPAIISAVKSWFTAASWSFS